MKTREFAGGTGPQAVARRWPRRARGLNQMTRMNKSYRQGQILKLIRAKQIPTQEELAQALKKLGIAATQVTLSRDIRELRPGEDAATATRKWRPRQRARSSTLLAGEFLQDVRVAQNLVVLKTAPGHANSVAVALDNEEWPEVVGTIAGDDTILVIAPDSGTAEAVGKRLLAMVAAER